MNNTTKYVVGGGLVLVLIVSMVIFSRRSPEINENTEVQEETTEQEVTSTTPAPASGSTSTVKPTTTTVTAPKPTTPSSQKVPASKPASESYTDALEKYRKSGYYIQFYPCQATPGSLIVKQGSRVMFDNRDSKTHEIAYKSSKYRIGAYNFAVGTFNTIGTNYVTCDGGGSAVVTVVP